MRKRFEADRYSSPQVTLRLFEISLLVPKQHAASLPSSGPVNGILLRNYIRQNGEQILSLVWRLNKVVESGWNRSTVEDQPARLSQAALRSEVTRLLLACKEEVKAEYEKGRNDKVMTESLITLLEKKIVDKAEDAKAVSLVRLTHLVFTLAHSLVVFYSQTGQMSLASSTLPAKNK